jgi:hypothetical protein
MAGDVRYPSLYQINTRIWLRRLSRQHGKTVALKARGTSWCPASSGLRCVSMLPVSRKRRIGLIVVHVPTFASPGKRMMIDPQ